MVAVKSEDASIRYPMSQRDRLMFALADLEYVLTWLRQSEAPENIILLQERAADLIVGRDAS